MVRFAHAFILALALIAPAAWAADTVVLTEDNHIALTEVVAAKSVGALIDKIQRSQAKELYLYIDSPGGSVDAGLQLIDVMKGSGKKFICVANSAASMAFSILQQCDVRMVTEHAIIMQHMGSYGLEGQVPNVRTFNDLIVRIFQTLLEMDAARLKLTPEELYAKTRDDYWLFGREAIRDNAADRVTSIRCDKALSEKRNVQQVQTFFGSFELTMSACPLVSYPLDIKVANDQKAPAEAVDKVVREYIDAMQARKFFEDRMRTTK